MSGTNVIVLGGGSGGLAAASRLKELLGNKVSVTVIDKQSSFVMGFSLLRVMIGEKTAQEVAFPKEKISQRGIKFVNSEINEINVKNNLVRTGQGDTRSCKDAQRCSIII